MRWALEGKDWRLVTVPRNRIGDLFLGTSNGSRRVVSRKVMVPRRTANDGYVADLVAVGEAEELVVAEA
jgi:hypothetical protein